MNDTSWIPAIANLSGTGLIAVLFVWVMTKRLPAQEEAYRRDIQTMSTLFQVELKAERQAFQTELAMERASREDQAESFRNAVTELSASTLTSLQQVLLEVKEIKNGRSRSG